MHVTCLYYVSCTCTQHLCTRDRLHFQARSPSPSSKFEFQPLHFIEPPDHNGPAGANMGRVPQPISASELRLGRLPSSSDYREEALSFSSLPTSQFALKPSTSDVELSDQQHSLLTQRAFVDATLEPYSWSWVQNARLNPLQVGSFWRTSDHVSSNISGNSSSANASNVPYPHPSAVPSNYHPIGVPGTSVGGSGIASSSMCNQQQLNIPGSSSSSSSEPRDISRSSLSVTNSKTIILSNAPVSHAQSTSSNTASAAAPATKTASGAAVVSKPSPVPPPVPNAKGVTAQSAKSQQQQPQQPLLPSPGRAGLGSKSSLNQSPAQQQQDVVPQRQRQGQPSTKPGKKENKEKQDKVVETKTPNQSESANQAGRSGSSVGDQSSTKVAESAVTNPSPKTASSREGEQSKATSNAVEPMDTSPSSATSKKSSVPPDVEKSNTTDSKGSLKKTEGDKSSEALSAWMMSKPAANILQLSCPHKRKRSESDSDDSPKSKHSRTLFASADAAMLITSQFAKQMIKKEETGQPLTVTHALNSAVVGIGARNALSTTGLPLTSDSPISHSLSKLQLPVVTAPSLPVTHNAAKLLSIDSIQPLQQHQQAAVNSVQDGGGHIAVASVGQEKKTVVNAVSASGQAQALPASLAVRRSSTGTNGTNSYQEIFHTERMKQALAG